MKHFDTHDILVDNQHAFRRHRSCETQLINTIDDWASSLDQGFQIDSFVLDFEKAFDTVPHELLKTKLHMYGVSSQCLNWISDFLSSRSQCVIINGIKSSTSKVISGVPQGTVLGPLLFLVHINDILKNTTSTIKLFADDCVCYRRIKSTNDCVQLQKDIDTLGQWARTWGMRFQPRKCNMFRICKKRNPVLYNYSLEGSILEFTEHIKYLGVTISQDLNWNKHISTICNKAYKTLGLLKRNLNNCPTDVRLQAYKGLIRPVLEYACTVWDPHQNYLKEQIENVQKRSARFITSNYDYSPNSMTKILNDLKLEPLSERRKQNKLILLFKGINNKARIPIEQLVKPNRIPRSGHPLTFKSIYARTDNYKFSFIPDAVKLWNSLPPDILRSAMSSSEPITNFSTNIRRSI